MADSTFIACLTPPGKAAIATFAVRGPIAWSVTRRLFQPRQGELPDAPTDKQFWLGRLGETQRDEAILTVTRATPEPWLELHCHGGTAVSRFIESLYTGHGVEVCGWQELEQCTGIPEWQVDAREWLVQAPTARTAAILLNQYAGAFHNAMAEIHAATDTEGARQRLARLVQLVPLGRHLVKPWSVVIGGAPNVGKSSLVNALAGYTRSVVAPTPGTTRDVVSTVLAIDGWPIELCDTAGLRHGDEAIEAEGIARARQAAAAADLRIWVVDGSAADAAFVAGSDWYVVINKTDLPAAWDWTKCPEAPHVSAVTGSGVAALCAAISRWLVPAPPAAGEAVPYSPTTCDDVLRLLEP
jgi:tRNA modification GTPase